MRKLKRFLSGYLSAINHSLAFCARFCVVAQMVRNAFLHLLLSISNFFHSGEVNGRSKCRQLAALLRQLVYLSSYLRGVVAVNAKAAGKSYESPAVPCYAKISSANCRSKGRHPNTVASWRMQKSSKTLERPMHTTMLSFFFFFFWKIPRHFSWWPDSPNEIAFPNEKWHFRYRRCLARPMW